jgi:mono/diheme cytochrome c family protein
MARQPSYRPMAPSAFFKNQRSAQPLEPGTVARGYLRDDDLLYRGIEGKATPLGAARATGLVLGLSPLSAATSVAVLGSLPEYAEGAFSVGPHNVRTFPFPIDEALMKRGRSQFNIYCSVCHDRVGTGNGRIVQRGYLRPPSLHSTRLRLAPEGYFFEVISNGWGGMPAYNDQITPQDRWAIVAYVRALQRSQNPRPDDQPKEGPK